MSKTYQEILKTMTDEFTERTGMEIDAASDIGIRMQVVTRKVITSMQALRYRSTVTHCGWPNTSRSMAETAVTMLEICV